MKILGYIFAIILILGGGIMLTCGGIFITFNIWSGLQLLCIGVLIILGGISIIRKDRNLDSSIQARKTLDNKIISKETLELADSLLQVDISSVLSITFLPISGQGFTIKTPNIKRLSVYITTKLEKTTFEGEELRKAFDHVITNISSDLSKTDFNLIQGKINEFVKSGGEVRVNKI